MEIEIFKVGEEMLQEESRRRKRRESRSKEESFGRRTEACPEVQE